MRFYVAEIVGVFGVWVGGFVGWSTVVRAEEVVGVWAVRRCSRIQRLWWVLVKNQELLDERESRLDNPEAVVAREESQTEFEGLGSRRAAKVDGEAFSRVVDDAGGWSPTFLKVSGSVVFDGEYGAA